MKDADYRAASGAAKLDDSRLELILNAYGIDTALDELGADRIGEFVLPRPPFLTTQIYLLLFYSNCVTTFVMLSVRIVCENAPYVRSNYAAELF